jgi:hypothetical protein
MGNCFMMVPSLEGLEPMRELVDWGVTKLARRQEDDSGEKGAFAI